MVCPFCYIGKKRLEAAAEQAGKAIGNIIGLINTMTLPAKFANVWAERNFEKYAEKLKDIPKENIKEVEPEIAIPLIEKLSYTSNSDLAEAYANLLAKASHKDDIDLINKVKHKGTIELNETEMDRYETVVKEKKQFLLLLNQAELEGIRSKYGKRLYSILVQYHLKNKLLMTISDLREIMEIPETYTL